MRLEQILTNLCGNACKFTKDGEVNLAAKTQNSYVVFEVSDSGIGMTNTQVENVFNEYQQASSATAKDYGGTGLGLAISKQLVELMGGEVSATSVIGQGSVFSVKLPIDGDGETLP